MATSNLSRRSVLVGAVAAVPAAALPAIAALSPDAELIALAAEIDNLMPRYRLAVEASKAADDQYEIRKPRKPEALLHRFGDPIGRDHHAEDFVVNGRRRMWCNIRDIDELRGVEFRTYWFAGEDHEFAKTHSKDFDQWGRPTKNQELWASKPDPERQKRARDIIQAFDQWEAEKTAMRDELNIAELDARYDDIVTVINERADCMVGIEASTLEGIRAKARIVQAWEWDGTDKNWVPDLLASLMKDLLAAGG